VRNDDIRDTAQDEKAGRSPELARAEADVERARERVAQSVMALRDEVARRTDWRQWIRRRPTAFLAAAFLAGFFLGRRNQGGRASNPKTRRTRSWR
jgi:hypothetical protein